MKFTIDKSKEFFITILGQNEKQGGLAGKKQEDRVFRCQPGRAGGYYIDEVRKANSQPISDTHLAVVHWPTMKVCHGMNKGFGRRVVDKADGLDKLWQSFVYLGIIGYKASQDYRLAYKPEKDVLRNVFISKDTNGRTQNMIVDFKNMSVRVASAEEARANVRDDAILKRYPKPKNGKCFTISNGIDFIVVRPSSDGKSFTLTEKVPEASKTDWEKYFAIAEIVDGNVYTSGGSPRKTDAYDKYHWVWEFLVYAFPIINDIEYVNSHPFDADAICHTKWQYGDASIEGFNDPQEIKEAGRMTSAA